MLHFALRRPRVGLEIQPAALRLAAPEGTRSRAAGLVTKITELPGGMVSDGFEALNIHDWDGLLEILRNALGAPALHSARRAALSLPDSVFRVHVLEFDRLPNKKSEIERLVRWRLEKSAAFETSDIALRYQIFKQRGDGFIVVASAARTDVLSQYEALILALGLESWTIGLSSFHTLNFYYRFLAAESSAFAFAHVYEDSFAAMIMERGELRFYRFKEIKKCGPEEMRDRLLRELEDSLHFYTHRDRKQPSEVGRLYCSGDPGVLDGLTEGLRNATSRTVETLSPDRVLGPGTCVEPELAAALGAGSAL